MPSYDRLFIGGGWVPPSTTSTIEVRNASTGEHIGSVPEAAEADVDGAVAAARRAFDDPAGWSYWTAAERASALERLATELEARAPEIGRLVSMQNGMPIALSPIIEGLTAVGTLRYVASLLATSPVEEETARFLGGGRPAGLDRGWFVQPTVFADVDNKAVIAQEEIFGPVLSIVEYTDEDDAIRIANESDYGLGGSVWTSDLARARSVVRRVRTGTMGINGYLPDPAGPWGGVKSSGLGRELGPGAIAAYQNLKTVYA
jgi:acyl-CoA reductase-like NAD-dependent aldehyde dehydrogenase